MNGGSIAAKNASILNIYGCQLLLNKAQNNIDMFGTESNGGALSIEINSILNMQNCTVHFNQATQNGMYLFVCVCVCVFCVCLYVGLQFFCVSEFEN